MCRLRRDGDARHPISREGRSHHSKSQQILLPRGVTVNGPAAWVARRDFAGCEERGRDGRAALSELAKASEFAALPRPRDERVYAQERRTHPLAGL